MIRDAGVVNFKCPTCQRSVTEIYSPITIYSLNYQHPQTHYETDLPVQCPFCMTAFSVHVKHIAALTWIADLPEYPDVAVTFEDTIASTNWLPLYPPDDPFAVWTEAYHRLGDIIATYGIGGRSEQPELSDVINRMVFSGAIAAIEAFLSDMLMQTVMSNQRVFDRFLLGHNGVKEAIALASKQGPVCVRTKTREYVASRLYHRLDKVGQLYLTALEVDIFSDLDALDRLNTAVLTRHDIVHRNGKTTAGAVVELSTSDVARLLTDLNDFAFSVVGAVHWSVNRHIEIENS